MMNFEKRTDTFFRVTARGEYYVATNSLKPVYISEDRDGTWVVDMPEYCLFDRYNNAVLASFDAAKRYAESNVGMTMDLETN